MKTEKQSEKLHYLLIRLSKQDAAFTYFILESQEGLCFYSTCPHEPGELSRKIEIFVTSDFVSEVKRLLSKLQQQFSLEILEEKTIDSTP